MSRSHPAITFAVALGLVLLVGMPAGAQPKVDDPAAVREKLLKEGGGNAQSEAAVAAGLAWLARQQQKDGSWKFDGVSKEQVAATGFALLPFLAAGEGPTKAVKYQKVVQSGIDWLIGKVGPNGFLSKNMYAQAIGTIALCDAYLVSKSTRTRDKSALAVAYIVKAQARNGSWGYTPNTDGDTSILGWQVQALTAARLAGIKFDHAKVYKEANKFLDSVSSDGGSKFGYRERGASITLTPVGLLSRTSMGVMAADDEAFKTGVEFVKRTPPRKEYWDTYYYFYATRVMFHRGGADWHKGWNPKMRDLLIDLQDQGADDATRGS
jgi:hypothetical protein